MRRSGVGGGRREGPCGFEPMKTTAILLALAMFGTFAALTPAAGAETLSTNPYLKIGDIATMRLPTSLVTWSISDISEGAYNHKLNVYLPDGSQLGAVRFQSASLPLVEIVQLDDAPIQLPTLGAAQAQTAHCNPTVHSWTVCADVFYNGGGAPVYNQGSASGMSSSYYCYNCLQVQGCQQTIANSCSNTIYFTVSGTSTTGSVCWTWGALRYVWTYAVFDGAGVASDKTWVGVNTSC